MEEVSVSSTKIVEEVPAIKRSDAPSPSRTIDIITPKESGKTFRKFGVSKIAKLKTEPVKSVSAPVAARKSTGVKTTPTAPQINSRIPTKRTFMSSPARPSVLTARTQLKSSSRISLAMKELGGPKKVETSVSSHTVKANPLSARLSSATPRANSARGAQTSRRSSSAVSCPTKSDDAHAQQPLTKIASFTGDQENHMLSARERVAENNKVKVFETLQKKLQEMQSEFMQKFETLKLTSPDKMKTDYKFISMVRSDDCKLIVNNDDLVRMPKKIPVASVNDFREKVKSAMDELLLILTEGLNEACFIGSESERSLKVEETRSKLEKEQALKLQELYGVITDMCVCDYNPDAQIVRMQREIQEAKKALLTAEETIAELQKAQVQREETVDLELHAKLSVDLMKRDAQMAELSKKNLELENEIKQAQDDSSEEKKKLQEELRATKENAQTLNKRLMHLEQQVHNEKKDKQDKTEAMKKLEAELEATRQKVEDLRSKVKNETTHHRQEHQREMAQLKSSLEALQKDKEILDGKVLELKEAKDRLDEIRVQLNVALNRVHELEATIENHKSQPEQTSHEILSELTKLRQSEAEKRREIEKLKVELSKAHFNVCQMEEQVQRDQQLLEVRSELINSLQTNDNSQRIHLEEMFANVGEKTNTINELNSELRNKSEEFRNLFTTLSTKQMELSRQEHMIKLLEQSNERSQMLRVKQEEKIGRMEEEISQLKESISIYQNHLAGGAGLKNLLLGPRSPRPSQPSENVLQNTTDRRRKRQVEISVRKYQT